MSWKLKSEDVCRAICRRPWPCCVSNIIYSRQVSAVRVALSLTPSIPSPRSPSFALFLPLFIRISLTDRHLGNTTLYDPQAAFNTPSPYDIHPQAATDYLRNYRWSTVTSLYKPRESKGIHGRLVVDISTSPPTYLEELSLEVSRPHFP